MFRRIVMCISVTAALATQAWAQLPAVMRHVPQDAMATIVIPSIDQLDRNVAAVTAALEIPAAASPKQMLAMMGMREGIDFTRPVAIVIGADVVEMGDDVVALLVPTTDYATMIGQFQPEKQNGLDAFAMNGSPAFAKALDGGYALVAQSADFATNYAGGMNAEALAQQIGAAGLAVAAKSDIDLVPNMPMLAELGRMALGEARMQMAEQAPMMAAMSGQDPEALMQQMEMSFDFAEQFLDEAGGAVVGVSAGALGVSFDMATAFKDGTEMAGWFNAPGDSGSLMNRMPNKPFLFAGAADLTGPGLRSLMTKYADVIKGAPVGMPGLEGVDVPAALENINGYAFSAYQNPAGLMGGLFAGAMIYVDAKDPAAMRALARDTINKVGAVEGSPVTTRFSEGAVDVNGKAVDSWGMTMQPDPNNPMAGQAMMMMFGPGGGPGGLLATTDSGLFVTYSQNPQTLGEALSLNAANSLAGNQLLAQVAANLPEPRTAEMYYGVQSILEQVAPFLAMFLGPVDLMPDQPLPPIGMGMSTGAGAFHAGVFVPMPVIQTGVQGAMQIQAMQQQMDQGGDDQPPF
ncbi:MAG: hypothetical protein ACF8QF_07735 [Phycisphaerales bacterium]